MIFLIRCLFLNGHLKKSSTVILVGQFKMSEVGSPLKQNLFHYMYQVE